MAAPIWLRCVSSNTTATMPTRPTSFSNPRAHSSPWIPSVFKPAPTTFIPSSTNAVHARHSRSGVIFAPGQFLRRRQRRAARRERRNDAVWCGCVGGSASSAGRLKRSSGVLACTLIGGGGAKERLRLREETGCISDGEHSDGSDMGARSDISRCHAMSHVHQSGPTTGSYSANFSLLTTSMSLEIVM